MSLASFARAKIITGLSSFDVSEGAALTIDCDNDLQQRCGYIFYAALGTPASVTEYRDGGEEIIQVTGPIVAITSIKEYDVNGNVSQTFTASEYTFYSRSGIIQYRIGVWPKGHNNIQIIYTTGIKEGDLRYTMAIQAATHFLCARMFASQANAEANRVTGSSSYSLEGSSENFGGEGPYSAQIKYHIDIAERIISRMPSGLKERL